jgi:hypothetical protein
MEDGDGRRKREGKRWRGEGRGEKSQRLIIQFRIFKIREWGYICTDGRTVRRMEGKNIHCDEMTGHGLLQGRCPKRATNVGNDIVTGENDIVTGEKAELKEKQQEREKSWKIIFFKNCKC